MSFAVAAAVTAGVGLAKLGVSLSGRKKRIEEQKKAKAEMEQKKKAYEALDTSNVYKNMENKMEDLTINQKGMQLQTQQGQQQRANIMQQMKGAAGASGIAALAQSMAQQGQIGAQRISADIGKQEQAIQMAKAKGAADVQQMERQAELQIAGGEQQAEAQSLGGAETARGLQWQRTGTLLGMSQQRVAGSKQAVAAAQQQEQEGLSTVASGGGQMAQASDRRLKKNINLVDKSPEGINIYNFEYITN